MKVINHQTPIDANPIQVESFLPSDRLRSFVKKYLFIESSTGFSNNVLPDTSITIVLRIKGSVDFKIGETSHRVPKSSVSGLRQSARQIYYQRNAANLIIQLTETGGMAFLKEPLHLLFEENVPLNAIVSERKIALVEELLSGAKDNLQRVKIAEEFLLSILNQVRADNLILSAIEKIHSTNGIIKIKDLAKSLYISQDAFEKRFRKIVGASPKQFSSIIRMRSVIDRLKLGSRYTDLGFDAGYFDQPHFGKQFKIFTGQSPTDFTRSGLFW